ncbi:M48 family metallopeptidase [uncultured Clostridium sp.]|nr:M48 family metallopeptidase [uncultured Clostridium sp.]
MNFLFNSRCVMAKSTDLDYIVVHEMCHMYYMCHSHEFCSLVAYCDANYEARKEWLRDYGIRLDI